MRGKKLAFIFTEEKDSDFIIRLYSGLFASFRYLTHNFQTKVFTKSDQMNVIQRGFYDIYLRESLKTLNFAVNTFFEPTHVFFITKSMTNIEDYNLPKTVPKFVIYKGKEHSKEYGNNFKKVIVELPEEVKHYENAVYKSVVNTDSFNSFNAGKFYTVCFPQEHSPEDDDIFPHVNVFGSISWNYPTTINMPMFDTDIQNVIFNQSKCVLLLNDNDSVEFALSALACNTPVVAVEGIKASKIPGVLIAKRDPANIIDLVTKAWNVKYNFRDAFITPNFNPKGYAEMIMEVVQ
jgi:hypothetical protein